MVGGWHWHTVCWGTAGVLGTLGYVSLVKWGATEKGMTREWLLMLTELL